MNRGFLTAVLDRNRLIPYQLDRRRRKTPRTVVRRARFEPETMSNIIFKTSGAVLISYMKKGKTIYSESYDNDCLKPMLKAVAAQRPKSGLARLKLFHDNARPHFAEMS